MTATARRTENKARKVQRRGMAHVALIRKRAAAELLARRAARNSLLAFTKYTNPQYEPAWFHHRIAEYLEAVERGEVRRLIINLPPRHGKSELVSRRFPAWFLGRNPEKFIIAASYNSDLATDFGRDVRDIVASDEYRRLFPDVALSQDSRAANRWHVSVGGRNRGTYYAAGIGTSITGRGAHVGLIDDPYKDAAEAMSAAHRKKVSNWFRSTFISRLMPGAAVIICMSRWRVDDLVGELLDEGAEEWHVLKLKALDEERGALWPEWYDAAHLRRLKSVMGRWFEAQYQQEPVVEGGDLIRLDWFPRWRAKTAAPALKVLSVDTAFSERKGANPTAACVFYSSAKAGEKAKFASVPQWQLVEVVRRNVAFPDLVRLVVGMDQAHGGFDAVLIEDKASGQSLIQQLRETTSLPVVPVAPVADKPTRLLTVSPMLEAGLVALPEPEAAPAPWLHDLEMDLVAFPSPREWDALDALGQFLGWLSALRARGRSAGLVAPVSLSKSSAWRIE